MILIQEKDHRPKMIKFGISKEVADYLHEFNDKYSIWFADQFNKSPQFLNTRNQVNFVHNKRTQMQSIVDWVRSDINIKLKDYTFDEALAKSEEYHNNLEIVTIGDVERNKIIKTYRDGYYWVDLEDTNSSEERGCMGHCGSTSAETLYSLRKLDPAHKTFECFITLAISPDDGKWLQCKGKRNSKPKEEYYPYIVDILIASNVFSHENEYDGERDFTAEDFKEYVENNKDDIENADEILEKISEDMVTIDDFQKILDETDTGNFHIWLDDEGGGITYNITFGDDFTYEELKLDDTQAEDFVKKIGDISYVIERNTKNILYDITGLNIDISEYSFENNPNEETITLRLDTTPENYRCDKTGLEAFEEFISNFESVYLKPYERNKFIKNFNLLEDLVFQNDFDEILSFAGKAGNLNRLNLIGQTSYKEFTINSDTISFNHNIPDFKDMLVGRYVKGINTAVINNVPKKYSMIILMLLFIKTLTNDILPQLLNGWKISITDKNITFQKVYKKTILDDEDEEDSREKFNAEQEIKDLKEIDDKIPYIMKKLNEFQENIMIPIDEAKQPYTYDDIEEWNRTDLNFYWNVVFKDGNKTQLTVNLRKLKPYATYEEKDEFDNKLKGIENNSKSEFVKDLIAKILLVDPIYKYPTMKYNSKDYQYYVDQIKQILSGQPELKFESFQQFFQLYYS